MTTTTTDRESPVRVRLGPSREPFQRLLKLDAAKRVKPLSTGDFLQVVLERGVAAMIADLPPAQAVEVLGQRPARVRRQSRASS